MDHDQSVEPNPPSEKQQQSFKEASEIESWLISYLSTHLNLDPEEIDETIPFERYGLDSESAIVLSGDLQQWLQCDLDPTLLFDYPTIQALAHYLASELSTSEQ
ncbi:phosphopantetheine-binding [Gloeothece citriformis PCC 7424]|uniref:Phosphopantetheine-binding n=1 Tax=Gloeothece citriformis (strain PCC 7424) TaxID=65393 RepID=B7K7V1_GLOC7|nr:acyl carrier protein [Gloeothece citriformis]ACK71147.1 phosphopantetheine-binding [Gloeothece citriformis PCC 7424]